MSNDGVAIWTELVQNIAIRLFNLLLEDEPATVSSKLRAAASGTSTPIKTSTFFNGSSSFVMNNINAAWGLHRARAYGRSECQVLECIDRNANRFSRFNRGSHSAKHFSIPTMIHRNLRIDPIKTFAFENRYNAHRNARGKVLGVKLVQDEVDVKILDLVCETAKLGFEKKDRHPKMSMDAIMAILAPDSWIKVASRFWTGLKLLLSSQVPWDENMKLE
ncbi:uncharacterized protein C8R40DRAFT_1186722 [Lentinula edodes]|uniref:uncharacterized protein n=1 Tax=Lentinula edodes TaxID=5353 RepID=UPI001E8D188C|nr:uncharacterized protein C8R40DRAFT_1186722 [Lentinula edodes]KAH7876164.1 hypothetical protein C8R40DRAFT_1186722 [Lentinula edodes]KAJ3914903.1 hypothetical protein F5877DRAFT_70318 [Lentinula edodes]